MRLLSPSEIELWELAKKATPGPWEASARAVPRRHAAIHAAQPPKVIAQVVNNGTFQDQDADALFISKANPLTVSSLLETLEKTREAAKALAHLVLDKYPSGYSLAAIAHIWGDPNDADAVRELEDLLSGFSGDAGKEERDG